MQLSIEQALRRGIEAHQAGQIQEADKYYTAVLKVQPKNPDANHNMGALAVSIGKIKEALPFFKFALEANQNVDQFWLSYIETLILLDRLEDAKSLLKRAKKHKVNFRHFAYLDQKLKSPIKMSGSETKVKLTQPNILDSLKLDQALKLAIKYTQQGSAEEAKRVYNDILRIFPKNKKALEGIKVLWGKTHLKGKAVKDPPENQVKTLVNLCIQGQFKKSKDQALLLLSNFPNSVVLHNIVGAANQGLGELDEAVDSYRKAISINPKFAEAYYNIGNVLHEQNKLLEAVSSFKKAVSIKPNYSEAFNNMGVSLQEKGKLDEAMNAYEKAIEINSDFAEAFNNMGTTLKNQNKMEEAVQCFQKALSIRKNYTEALINIGYTLKNIKFTEQNPEIKVIINDILDSKTIVRPSDLSTASISLLKLEPAIQNILCMDTHTIHDNTLLEIVSDLSDIPLLTKFLSVSTIADLELETALTRIRSNILSSIFEISENSNLLKFQTSLALHCFTNEYIFNVTADEIKALQKLESYIKQHFSEGTQPNPRFILCLASYKSLYKYDWSDAIIVTNCLQEVYTRQVLQPQEEEKLKSEIKVLGEISNRISSKVREQYEESPYPRWVNLGLRHKPCSISKVVSEENLRILDQSINEVKAPKILIAGCGTGEHSIVTAARFDNSEVLAVDLSLSSLAYAKRKTKELNLQNINYMQADILDLQKSGRKFDIIESIGVLHHMEDPMAGFKVLVECLKPGGLLKVGLYSELARKSIVEVKKEVAKSNISTSADEILSFRNQIIKSDKPNHKQLQSWRDFYSLSELKDLIFHVQEHRFTIPKIKKFLKELQLNFCGFESDIAKRFSFQDGDKRALYNLDEWNKFENANPKAFAGMYQFWCQKT